MGRFFRQGTTETIGQFIGQTARLSALTPVAAAAADETAHEALPRIADAQRAVAENFQLQFGNFPMDKTDLLQCQLTAKNHTAKAVFIGPFRAPHIVNGHLSTAVQAQSRQELFYSPCQTDILNDQTVDTDIVQKFHIIKRVSHFGIGNEGVHRHIDADTVFFT